MNNSTPKTDTIRLALDWTPNTNNTGFFVAQQKGFYEENGIVVEIITPEADNYSVTPAKKLELGSVDLALASLESVISYNTKKNPMPCKAVAALLQDDLSAIVTLASSGIASPKELDGKRYASYKARYEDEIVRQMIRNAGGTGEVQLSYPEKLGIWDTLLAGNADATWIFTNWEGVEAEMAGVELNTFRLADFGIPYGYSPVIIARENAIREKEEAFAAFLQATKKGFLYAKDFPAECSAMLLNNLPEKDRSGIDLQKSQIMTAASYGDKNSWGLMQRSRIQDFIDFLRKHNLENNILLADEIFTNALLA